MLFHLFIAFQIIYSISCDVTCHNCPIDANTFDYLVTADRLPDQLKDCTTTTTDDICKIDIMWSQNPNQTQIALSGRDERMINDEKTLSTNVQLENRNNSFLWTRSTSYTCTTDMCNSFDLLKRVLNSLTLSDSFQDLQELLVRIEDFSGDWCEFKGNTTTFECADKIPTTSCKLCSFEGYSNRGSYEICASCLQDDIGETFLSHEVNFNMTDRTQQDHWMLECQTRMCNTIENGKLIRQKSTANFDFAKFFDDKNKSTTLSSISKMILIFIVFFIKLLN